MENLFAQALGIIAATCTIYWMTLKDDKTLKKFSLWGNLIWMSHYFLLSGGLIWGLMNILGIFKSYFSINQTRYIWYGLIFSYGLMWVVLYDWFLYILPVFAWILSTIWMFFYKWVWTRLFIAADSVIWLIYNYSIFSIWWMIMEASLIIILLYNVTKNRTVIWEINCEVISAK